MWERAKTTMKNYVASFSLVLGAEGLLVAPSLAERTTAALNLLSDADQLSGFSDGMEDGTIKKTIKTAELVIGLYSLSKDVPDLINTPNIQRPNVEGVINVSIGAMGSVGDADEVGGN